jgi:hypothetical protein
MSPSTRLSRAGYEIRYQPLSGRGRELSFPCARNDYLFARAVVGREYARPAILPCDLH